MSKRQLSGSVCSRIGTMNISAITIGDRAGRVPDDRADAERDQRHDRDEQRGADDRRQHGGRVMTSVPEKVTAGAAARTRSGAAVLALGRPMQFTFALAGIVTVWKSEAATPLPDSIAWPDEERDERGDDRDHQRHRREHDRLGGVDHAPPGLRGQRGADHPGGVLRGDHHRPDDRDDQLADLEERPQRGLGRVEPGLVAGVVGQVGGACPRQIATARPTETMNSAPRVQ